MIKAAKDKEIDSPAEHARLYLARHVRKKIEEMGGTQVDAAAKLKTSRQQVAMFLNYGVGGMDLLLRWGETLGIRATLVLQLPNQKTETFKLTKASAQAFRPKRALGKEQRPRAANSKVA